MTSHVLVQERVWLAGVVESDCDARIVVVHSASYAIQSPAVQRTSPQALPYCGCGCCGTYTGCRTTPACGICGAMP